MTCPLTSPWRRLMLASVLMAGTGLLAAATNDDRPLERSVLGTPAQLGQGTVQTFATLDRTGELTTLGVKISEAAMTSPPREMRMLQIPLPPAAAGFGYDHVGFDWNPQGHVPAGVYDIPHFDFHFYNIPVAEQMAIPGGPEPTPLPAANTPPDYMSTGESVPMMGVHWVDRTAPELNGRPFTRTLIYGSYQGKAIFVEPMITKAHLETLKGAAQVSEVIKQPAAAQRSGLHPTRYALRYDSSDKTYVVELTGFVRQ
ncbi:MAG TPA: DUF5602 domain-containing protein [Gemmatimonadales bacterium]